jgi:flagellar assembly factor FliW
MLALNVDNVQIETSRFGTLAVAEREVISMPEGMIGFPGLNRFVIFRHKGGSPFWWLQSLENGDLAFILMDPLLLAPDYELNINQEDTALLGIETSTNGIQAWAVVNIGRQDPPEITANLLAPVVVNSQTRVGKQVVLLDTPYTLRHPVPVKGKQNEGK